MERTMNETQLATWLTRLVQIPSVSPAQAGPRAGTPGEAAMAAAVAGWFADLGGEVQTEAVLPHRPNVYGIWRGRSDRWLAVDVHTDTVGVEQMTGDPFSGAVSDGCIYGRGAVDDKATLAVLLALLEGMNARGETPAANLLIAASMDEEVGATGAPAAAAWIRRQGLTIDELIVAEPTLCTPIHGHKGVVRLALTAQGKAAHSSQPYLGHNAIVAAAQVITGLQEEHDRLQTLEPSPLGNAMLTVTLVNGGTGINVVPDTCTVALDRRVVVGENAATVAADLQALARRHAFLPLQVQELLSLDAFYQPPTSSLIRDLVAWSGAAPQLAPYGTNAWPIRRWRSNVSSLAPAPSTRPTAPRSGSASTNWPKLLPSMRVGGVWGKNNSIVGCG